METKLWSTLIGLSKTVDSNPKTEHTDTIIIDCIQHLRNHTVTQDLIDLVHEEKDKISPSCKACTHPCGNTSDYDMALINDKKKRIDASNPEFKRYQLYISRFMLLGI